MDRRRFICTAAQALLVVPLAALAQQPVKVYRIGYLSPNARESPTSKAVYDDLRNSLGELGYLEGRNLVVDARWAEGKTELIPQLAVELVALKPDVIVVTTTPATLAVKQVAEAIPIVMINVTDPVGAGLVARHVTLNLCRPRMSSRRCWACCVRSASRRRCATR